MCAHVLPPAIPNGFGAYKCPNFLDESVLRSYLDEIMRMEGELQGLKDKIFSLDYIEVHMWKAANINRNLFDLLVAILRLMKQTRKEPTPQMIWMLMMGGINLLQIEVPTFISSYSILNWRPFLEQFQAAIHNKPHLRILTS